MCVFFYFLALCACMIALPHFGGGLIFTLGSGKAPLWYVWSNTMPLFVTLSPCRYSHMVDSWGLEPGPSCMIKCTLYQANYLLAS